MENDNIDAELLRDLEESAYPIVEQNKALLTRLKCRGFNPAKELDFTANNAGVLIHKFFESVAQFEEGKVPCAALEELFVWGGMLPRWRVMVADGALKNSGWGTGRYHRIYINAVVSGCDGVFS